MTTMAYAGTRFFDDRPRDTGSGEPDFAKWLFGAPGKRRTGRAGGGRMFEQGDLKLVILRLLDEKPRHGYEIIKALEELSRGAYAPSPGTVYPTLVLLEYTGHAQATPEDGGRKTYRITPAGSAFLSEHRASVESIMERIAGLGGGMAGAVGEIAAGAQAIGRAAYAAATRARGDAERLREVREIMERAAREIDALGE
jgi:DNA-binding PadR family transcriptional regulator